MTSKHQTIRIDATKRGYAAMWEKGGGRTSGGSATVIAGKNGEKRRPIYTPRGGHLACGKHALIGVQDGYHIITAKIHRGNRDHAQIKRIVSTSVKDIDGERWEATAQVEVVNTFSRGEWDQPLDAKFTEAVEATFKKAGIYHCRRTVYIDSSERPQRSADSKRREDERMRLQEAERAAKREAKAEREAREEAEAKAASITAKNNGLGARLEAVNTRLTVLGRETVKLDEASYRWGWRSSGPYTEENVKRIEQQVERFEAEALEAERKRKTREAFQPKFEVHVPRAEALGLTVEFRESGVRLVGYSHYDHTYTHEGLSKFTKALKRKEAELLEAEMKAQAEALYQQRKAEAEAAGLPQKVKIWKRTGGRTSAGNGWVIGPDGVDRAPTHMYNDNPRRLERYGEGYMVWGQILKGEVVLKWSKKNTAAEHVFEVVHLPSEGLTLAQKERIAEIEGEIEKDWDGRTGMSSGRCSPSVGDGWGLTPKSNPATEPTSGATFEDLQNKFNR